MSRTTGTLDSLARVAQSRQFLYDPQFLLGNNTKKIICSACRRFIRMRIDKESIRVRGVAQLVEQFSSTQEVWVPPQHPINHVWRHSLVLPEHQRPGTSDTGEL